MFIPGTKVRSSHADLIAGGGKNDHGGSSFIAFAQANLKKPVLASDNIPLGTAVRNPQRAELLFPLHHFPSSIISGTGRTGFPAAARFATWIR